MPFSNGLSPAENERLSLLAEECAEIIQVVMKIKRHGYDSHHPNDPHRTQNRELLMKELGDARGAVALMAACGDVDQQTIDGMADLKLERMPAWLHHQRPDILQALSRDGLHAELPR